MDFQEAREQFRILAQRYQNGQINGEDFADAVDALAIIDDQGREWKIGLQSGRWYRREGKEWVEAVPPTAQEKGATGPTERERETTRKVRNRVLMIVLLFAIASFCLGSFYFARGGQHFSLDIFGESGADSNTGENVQGGDGGGQSGGEGDQAISGTAQTTATASEDNGNVVVPEASQTAASTQSPAKPSETPTAEPPPPIAPPQVWRSLVDIQLDTPGKLTGDWSSVKQKAWEYEIINYKDRQALFIQYDSPEALLYSGGEQVVDIDRAVTLALPDPDGRVDILCRWQDNNGYAFSLTSERWRLVKIEDGDRIVLEDGRQADAFQQGGYATFRLRCVASQLAVWAGEELLTVEKDSSYTSGTTGLRFDPSDGIGLVYIARDQLRTHLVGRETATVADTVRLGLLDVTLTQTTKTYPKLTESAYSGQPLIGMKLRLSNIDGDRAVVFTNQNFYLVKAGTKVGALAFVPQVAGGAQPLTLPVTLEPGQTTAGEIFFAGIDAGSLETGWQLVVDLRYQALGEARFIIE